MSLTPNSRVSRTVRVEVNGVAMAQFLESIAMDKPAVPVRILFQSSGVSSWSLNAGKTLMLRLDSWPLDGLKVREPCVMVCDPKEMAGIIRAKCGDGNIRITADANTPISIKTKGRGGAEVMPADEDDCQTIPDRNILPHNSDGEIVFPMFENEPASSSAILSKSELRIAMSEMTTANAPYVVITFDNKSEARSGHWNGKTTRSWSPMDAKIKGESFTTSFTDTLNTIVSRFHNSTTQLRISKHKKGQFVVIETTDGFNVTILATEAIRE